MKITSCVPLAGQGVIARSGALVVVTDDRGPEPDPLLNALADVSASGGDGGDLVLRAARAALGGHGQHAWACAGATADGGVAALVHGHAMIAVRVDGGPDVTLTASDSVIPVSRKFAGVTVALSLTVGDPAAPDPQFWLGDGVVRGGGLVVTMTADVGDMELRTPVVAPPTVMPKVAPTVLEMDAAGAPAVMAGTPDSGATVNSDDWFAGRPEQQGAGPAGWHPPTLDAPAAGASAVGL